jgi:hypothetical protein
LQINALKVKIPTAYVGINTAPACVTLAISSSAYHAQTSHMLVGTDPAQSSSDGARI